MQFYCFLCFCYFRFCSTVWTFPLDFFYFILSGIDLHLTWHTVSPLSCFITKTTESDQSALSSLFASGSFTVIVLVHNCANIWQYFTLSYLNSKPVVAPFRCNTKPEEGLCQFMQWGFLVEEKELFINLSWMLQMSVGNLTKFLCTLSHIHILERLLPWITGGFGAT